MSLQVWLPLNGDLHNQGLADITVTNNGATVDNNGKIGKCYYFNGNSQYLQLSKSLVNLYTNDFSWAIWLKPTDSTRGIIFSEYASAGSSNIAFELLANRNIRIYWAGSPDWSTGITIAQNTWSHVAITRHINTLKVYVNGILKATKSDATLTNKTSSSFIRLGDDYRGGTTVSYMGYMNDARIYDHCLSDKEIEEIAKGLILHYKLNDSYMQSAENIMPNYLEMALGSANASTGTWRLAGSNNMTRERVLITDSPEGECYGFQNSGIQTANDGSCYGIDSFPLAGNSVYTISMWARIIDGSEGYAGYNVYNSTDKGGSYTTIDKSYRVTPLPASGEWVKCWYTFTTNASNTRNIYIGITTGSTSVTTQMCCVHIEKVDNTADTVIYDSSGYNNNGELYNYDTNGLIAITSDSPRYNVSTFINSANNTTNTASGTRYIYGHCALTNPTTMSVAFWCKPIAGYTGSTGQGQFCTTTYEFGNTNVGSDYQASAMNHRDSAIDINDSAGTTQCRPAFLPTANEWHHYVITYDGQTGKVYKDGVQSSTASFSAAKTLDSFIGVVIGFSKAGGVWRSNQSYFSDFRVYVTALTVDQVAELYHTSATIDNNGNIYSRELVEI